MCLRFAQDIPALRMDMERRIALNGEAYTFNEFVKWYGHLWGSRFWEQAVGRSAGASQPGGESSCEVLTGVEAESHPLTPLADLLYVYMFETATWTAYVWYDEPTWAWHHACDEFKNDVGMALVDMERTMAMNDVSRSSFDRGVDTFDAFGRRYDALQAGFVLFLGLYPAPRPQYRHGGKGKRALNRLLYPGHPLND